MNDLQVFGFEGRNVRVVEKDGSPWWVLRDVCDILEISNSRNVSDRLDDDEKGVRQMDTPGGMQEMTIINESGLFSSILRSDKPDAKRFRKWITSEVLPSIRKTGSYGIPADRLSALESRMAAIERLSLSNPSITKKSADPLDVLLLHADLGGWPRLLETTPAIFEHKGIRLEYSRAGITTLAVECRNSWIYSIAGAKYRYAFKNDPAFMDIKRVRMSGKMTECMIFSWHELEDRYE